MSPFSLFSEARISCCTERDIGKSIAGFEPPDDVETGFSNILSLCPNKGPDVGEEEGGWADGAGALGGGWE